MVSVQLTREGIRTGEQAQLESSKAESLRLGRAWLELALPRENRCRHHKQVLFCVTGRTDFAVYPLSARLGLVMHLKKNQPPHSF